MKERKDFVWVRLSPAGRAFAGESGTIRIMNAHSHYVFNGSIPVEVLRRGEWSHFLSRETVNNQPMFELAAEPAPPAVKAEISISKEEVTPNANELRTAK